MILLLFLYGPVYGVHDRRRGRVVRAWDTLTMFEATVCGRS